MITADCFSATAPLSVTSNIGAPYSTGIRGHLGTTFFRTQVVSDFCTTHKCELTGQRASPRMRFSSLTSKWQSWMGIVTKVSSAEGGGRLYAVHFYSPFVVLPETPVVLAAIFPLPLKQKVSFSDTGDHLGFLKQGEELAFGDHVNTRVERD